MADWTALTFPLNSLLTSTIMTQLQANLTALAEGAAGAPSVVQAAIGAEAVGQGEIKTTAGTVSVGGSLGGEAASTSVLTLPGGYYGFWPVLKDNNNANATGDAWLLNQETDLTFAGASLIRLWVKNNAGTAQTVYTYATQRYIQASGDVYWLFILRDKSTGEEIASYAAWDHPCLNNGGNPLLLPHPFRSYNPEKHEIVVVNPPNALIEEIEEKAGQDKTRPGGNVLEAIHREYEIDEDSPPTWPSVPISVCMPQSRKGTKAKVNREVIRKPDYILSRSLRAR